MTVGATQTVRSGRPRPTRRVLLRWGVGLAVGVAVVFVVVNAAGGLADSGRALGRTKPWWVGLAVGAEAVSYLLIGAQLRGLARPSAPVSRRLGLSLALVIAGFGLLTPGVPGGRVGHRREEVAPAGTRSAPRRAHARVRPVVLGAGLCAGGRR